MHWVLIIVTLGQINHVQIVPFATEELCLVARKNMEAAASGSNSARTVTSCSRTSHD